MEKQRKSVETEWENRPFEYQDRVINLKFSDITKQNEDFREIQMNQKEQENIKNLYHEYEQCYLPKQNKGKFTPQQIESYFSQVDAVIKSIKHCVQNIQSVFKKHSDCYSYIPIDKREFVDFWFLKVNDLILAGFDKKDYGKKLLTEMLTNAKYCEEHRRYFLDVLDTMYEVLIISEKAWREERKKSNTSTNDVDQKYVKILQSGFIDLLLTSTDKMEMEVDPITKAKIITATSPKTSLDIILNGCNVKLAQSESKILAVMLQKITDGETGTISIPLKELASILGKTNIKKARESIVLSFDNLTNTSIRIKGKDVKGEFSYLGAPLISIAKIEKSIVYFRFNEEGIKEYLSSKSNIMPINNDLFAITSNRVKNPYAWAIGWKISFQANFNRYKDKKPNNVFPISVKNLLEVCQRSGLPSYKKVNNTSQHISKLIISPIERDLDLLIDIGVITKWHYEDKQGNAVQDYIEIANDNPESDPYSIEKNKKFSEWKNRKVIIELPPEYLKQIREFDKEKIKKTDEASKKKKVIK